MSRCRAKRFDNSALLDRQRAGKIATANVVFDDCDIVRGNHLAVEHVGILDFRPLRAAPFCAADEL